MRPGLGNGENERLRAPFMNVTKSNLMKGIIYCLSFLTQRLRFVHELRPAPPNKTMATQTRGFKNGITNPN